MLQTLHEKFSGLIAKIVLGVIVIIFGGFFGIQSYMNPQTETFVASVNGREISQDEFRDRYNQYRSQMQRMYGKQFNALEFDLSLIHISEPTRLLSISYAVFCLKKKKKQK